MNEACMGCVRSTRCSQQWVNLYGGSFCPFMVKTNDPAFKTWRHEYIGRIDLGAWDHG